MSAQKLRIGLIGCGNIGSGSHLPAWLANPDIAELAGLADPTAATLEAARLSAGLTPEQTHLDPLELIARQDVDVIDICTPQHLRRDLILAAAEHGKHVVCEKPLAIVPADAASAVEAMAAAGRTLAMVHNYLWLPEVQAAQRAIDSGEIGRVRTATVNFLGIVDVPGSSGYAPRWRHDAALAGGGVLIDILHGVYLVESLLGEQLRRVSAYASNDDADSNVEDIALCRFETESNAGLVNIAWGYGPGGLEVTGTEGRVFASYRDGGTSPWFPLERVQVTTEAGTRTLLDVSGENQDDYQALRVTFGDVFRDFAAALAEDRAPRASGADGLRILEATAGALKSAVSGQLTEVPLEREDPIFERGIVGVEELQLTDWSPTLRRGLYRQSTISAEERR
jgi:predicted dehydrogenase